MNTNKTFINHTLYQNEQFENLEKQCLRILGNNKGDLSATLFLCSLYLQDKRFDEIINLCNSALNFFPERTELLIYLGTASKATGSIHFAVELLSKAHYVMPDHVHTANELAQCYISLGNIDKALMIYATLIKSRPNLIDIQIIVGNLLKMQGRNLEAKNWFMKILGYRPDCVVAWYQLGTIFMAEGELWLTIHYLEQATRLDVNFFDAQIALAKAFLNVKLLDRAITIYTQILVHFPLNLEAIVSIGSAYLDKGLHDLSIEYYQKAVDLSPSCAEYHGYLGNAFKDKGLVDDAERCYQHSLRLCPNHVDSLNNLANIKREKGQINSALSLYQRALKINPAMAIAHSNLGAIYHHMSRYNDSLPHYCEALRISPSFIDALLNLGSLYKDMQDANNAISCFSRAITLNPYLAEPHNQIGTVYRDNNKITEAIPFFKKALNLKPYFPEAYCNMSHCCLITCDWAMYDERAKNVVSIVRDQLGQNRFAPVHPHHSMLYPALTGELAIRIAEKYAITCIDKIKQLNKPPYSYTLPAKDERIRIGYVSYDFCNHPTSHLMQSIPGLHDSTKFEIFCYALNPSDGTSFRTKISDEVEHFIDLSKTLDNGLAADIINKDGIHILINVNGYTKGARNELFALKPAPIQIMWLGYPNTSGASYMDYIVLDRVTAPISLAHLYTEKLAHMPNSFFIGDHMQMFKHLINRYTFASNDNIVENSNIINFSLPSTLFEVSKNSEARHYTSDSSDITTTYPLPTIREINESIKTGDFFSFDQKSSLLYGSSVLKLYPRCSSGENYCTIPIYTCRKMYNLPENAIVYCNFNQFYKYDPHTFAIWCQILHAVPNSVLWLLMFPPGGQVNVIETAKRHQIPENRIIFSSVAPKEEHVRRGQLADICLDTYNCNGHTTGVDILFGGTPMVTLTGDHLASRVAASQLTAIGCPELVASTSDQYVNIATRLGNDSSFLTLTKKKIRENRFSTSLFKVGQYVNDLESLFRRMVNQHILHGYPVHLLNDQDDI